MHTVTSADGTGIAFEKAGSGPPLILVDGAMCHRRFGPMRAIADLLTDRFTVYTYDRRGRNESGDTQPYAVAREIEDLDAMITVAGGSAALLGLSSGAVLALRTAAQVGDRVTAVVAYEPPMIVDDTRPPAPADFGERTAALVAAGRRGDAVKLFMRQVGVPAFAVVMMRLMPMWRTLTAVAHTLPYDLAILGQTQLGRPLPAEFTGALGAITVPALLLDGGKSPAYLRNGVRAVAAAIPTATYETLEGQTHRVNADALVPVAGPFLAR